MLRPLLATLALLCTAAHGADKPNIIVIFTDDHGWPDIGAAGVYDDLKTPHLDKLAASGARATNGYVTAPQCVPSRAGLLTGKSQNRFGVESNSEPLDGFGAELTIAERLKKAGYATGQIGKWHLGPTDKITEHGFDDVYAKNANRPCHANYTLDGKTVEMGTVDDKLYHLDACSEAALAFIRRHEKDPFFLYLAYRAPHVPLDAPPKYLKRFPGEMPERRRQALAMISAMDDGVGAIVAELEKRGLSERTLIFYIGDNGAPLKIHKLDAPGGGPGWDGSLNAPMNGEKGMLTEGGIRVPFVVNWPETIPAGEVYEEPVISLDVAATAVAIAGLPADDKLDGVNLIPFLRGEQKGAPHDALTWRWVSQSAIREGKWKLLRGSEREYLFDILADPGEKENLRGKHPGVADRLRGKLERWAAELDPPGLATGAMSETWNSYFDFYLDGKPAPPLREKFVPKGDGAGGDTRGWIARGAKLSIRGGALLVTPEKGGRAQRTFIVKNGLKIDGAFSAEVRLRNGRGGKVGVAWRESGQDEFMKEQVVEVEMPASPHLQTLAIEVSAKGKTIHLRLVLPGGETSISHIRFREKESGKATAWKFADDEGARVPPAKRAPNLVFILADDLGWADTTLYGHTEFYQTPNIERLAARGMTFTRAYTSSPLCSPTRSAILTGLHPARTGITTPNCHLPKVTLKAGVAATAPPTRKLLPLASVSRLDTKYQTLAESLKSEGYTTGHFGKWHLGPEPYSPLQHGFEVDVPHHPGPGPAGSFVAPWKFRDFKERKPGEHIEDRMGDEAVAFMEANKDRPFFLNYWQFSVHAPFDAKRELIEKHRARVDPEDAQRSPTYAAMVESLDDNVGKILDAIGRLGIAEETIIIFYSDNGGNMYNEVDGTTPTSNRPLRGGKGNSWDGGVRVPAVVVCPGVTEPGSRSEQLITSTDFYPTVLDLLGIEAAAGQRFDGVSIAPALRGESLERDGIFTFFPHSTKVPDTLPPSVAVYEGDWKLLRLFHEGAGGGHQHRLFNLREDIGERHDLSSEQPRRLAALDARISKFLERCQAVTPRPNPRYRPDGERRAQPPQEKGRARRPQASRERGDTPRAIQRLDSAEAGPELNPAALLGQRGESTLARRPDHACLPSSRFAPPASRKWSQIADNPFRWNPTS